MKTPQSLLPSRRELAARLTEAFNGSNGRLRILERKLPRFMSTFPNEIVTCQLPDGRKRRVFIKYEAGHGHDSFGHRGNVGYEAEVYHRVLHSLSDFRPRCLGKPANGSYKNPWLILEYVYGSVRMSDLSDRQAHRRPPAMAESARWIARLHAGHEASSAEPSLSFLTRYDAQYYRGWATRMFEFSKPLSGRFPWLAKLRQCGDAWFVPLLTAPQTVIHGEFYAKTVLMRGEKLFMIDWESAAIAAGEIDLATLLEGKYWPAKIVRDCERQYQRARWPDGVPENFRQTLDAARIYLHFRWLGERPDWAVREKTLWRYDHLQAAAKRLGLI